MNSSSGSDFQQNNGNLSVALGSYAGAEWLHQGAIAIGYDAARYASSGQTNSITIGRGAQSFQGAITMGMSAATNPING